MTHIPQNIFRQYDIRGVVDEDLSPEFAKLLGRAYGRLAKQHDKKLIAIGEDCRLTSPEYAQNLAEGIAAEGIDVCKLGTCPTSLMYYSLFSDHNIDGGIQVTGSHNPSNMNGFKICLGKDSIHGEMIQTLKNLMLEIEQEEDEVTTLAKITDLPITQEYIDYMVENCRPHLGDRKLKIVVDAGNGVGGITGVPALKALGHEVIELYCDPDGTFPNHHPDPTEMHNLVDLKAKVLETKADLGIGWDGDGDRIGLVDENADVIFGDMILLIYARDIMKTVPDATVVADVKCSSLLFDDVNKRGGNAVIWKTGHSLIKSKLKELNGDLAGEMSGHIFFKNRFFGFDCASYCACRLAEILTKTQEKTSELLKDLPKVMNTPEIRLDCDDDKKFKIVAAAEPLFKDYKVNTTDGLRVEFENGWGLVRASNTQPVLVMRFEADNQADLEKYQNIVTEKINSIEL